MQRLFRHRGLALWAVLSAIGPSELGIAESITHGHATQRPLPITESHAPPVRLYVPNGAPLLGPNGEIETGNWSGYALMGTNYWQASGTWTVPAVSYVQYPNASSVEKSATWVGIGGFVNASSNGCTGTNQPDLIQIGTEQDITASGSTSYYAWYELLPNCQVELNQNSYPVSAGDVITASLACVTNCTPNNSQTTWGLLITNATRNWNWSGTFNYSSSLASAEWIEEAASDCNLFDICTISSLPDYGSAYFSSLYANEQNPNLLPSADIIMCDTTNKLSCDQGSSSPCNVVNGNQFFVDYGPSCISDTVQFAQQGNKLLGAEGGFQGEAVALSADGATAIVGGSLGTAAVFTRNNGVWTQQGDMLVGDGGFGYSAALSADGNTAIVGAPYDNTDIGAAWVFTRSGATWIAQAKLVGLDGIGGTWQGYSVAISADSNTVIVGGPSDNDYFGASWIFTRANGTWTQQAKLIGVDATYNAEQGVSVALSEDGNTAIVGGPDDGNGAGHVGAAWVFTRSNGVWTQQGDKLVVTNAAFFGGSVAISDDGNTAAVGAPHADHTNGSVFVFTRSNGSWAQEGPQLVGAGGVGDPEMGSAVALSADGNTLIAGGPWDLYENEDIGATWVFARSGGIWTQQGFKLVGSGAAAGGAFQGDSVAISGDGTTVIIGGGAAWVFDVSAPAVTAIAPTVGPSAGGSSITISGTNFNGASVNFGVKAASSFNVSSATSITATSPPGTGTVDVTVTTPNGMSATTAADQFTYRPLSDTHDFNADGTSDILWRDTSGNLAMWLMNAGQMSSGANIAQVPTEPVPEICTGR